MIRCYADARPWKVKLAWGGRFLLVALLGALVFYSGDAQAGGFALSGIGSKAIGMGGAFRGLADDWSAAYWNPAGLSQIEKSEITGMLVAIDGRPEFTPNIYYYGQAVGYRNGQTRYPNDKTYFIPDFSGFVRFNGFQDYVVGLAVYVPYGLGSEWDLFNPVGMNLANPYPWIDHKANVNIIDFHPTIARAFMDDKLSLGAGISFLRGDMTFQKTYLKSSGLPIPHQNLIINSVMDGSGWGYGANFGLLYKLSSKLQFGVSGRTASTVKLEGNADQELFTFSDNDLREILLANSITRAESMQVFFLFSSDNHFASPKAKADFKTPADIGFGFAFKPSEKLTLTGDLAYTQWSSLDDITIELNGADPAGQQAENSVIMLNWDNTLRFSLGAEYRVLNPLAIRLGYFSDPSPIPDETFTPLIPDMGDKNSVNIGAALDISGLQLSYNFEYISFKDRKITTLNDVNGDGIFDNYPGDYKMELYASHVSVTYSF